MKTLPINVRHWFTLAYAVATRSATSKIESENNRMNMANLLTGMPRRHCGHHRHHRHRLHHPRCVYLELVNRNAGRVSVAGSFNDWRPTATPMIPMGGGWWVKALVLPPGRHEYRFIVDDQEMPDPNALQNSRGSDGRINSVLVVPEKTER